MQTNGNQSYQDALATECECVARGPHLVRYFQSLAVTEAQSDVTIVMQSKLYRLHRTALNQSPFFASLLNTEWMPSGDAALHQIDFVLTDDFDSGTGSDAMNLIERTLFAWETVLVALYGGCAKALVSRITRDNFFDHLQVASYFDIAQVLDTCYDLYSDQLLSTVASADVAISPEAADFFASLLVYYEARTVPEQMFDLKNMAYFQLAYLGPHPLTRAILERCPKEIL
ncbi:Germ cell-less protein-like 1 [Blastocladiella emersonii ATCC 22665]|nr:Germ cell-less protein-like 1 [Blastocladiella emersonii ATCC 22665]